MAGGHPASVHDASDTLLDLRPGSCGPGALVLCEALDLEAARPLADAFKARRGTDLEVDASGVRRVGGLCLQVMLAAADAWTADGHRLVFHDPAPDFVASLELLGALPGRHTAEGDLS